MATVRTTRLLFVVSLACGVAVLSGCAWMRGRAPVAPGEPRLTSFDDLLPADVTAVVYLADLPASKGRFRQTELARRLRQQELQGIWKHVEFLRPWARAAFEQITEQVDEFAWGKYDGPEGPRWFLVARLNRRARYVLSRLHRRVLPRVSDEVGSLELVRRRFRGRRWYEWIAESAAEPRTIAAYTLVGGLFVMGSDAALVRSAIARRPAWWQFGGPRPGETPAIGPDELRRLRQTIRPGDDLFAWFEVGKAAPEPETQPQSRFGRWAAKLRQMVASRIETVSAGFQFTPPQITGRWRLDFTGSPRRSATEPRTPFDFAALVPDTARTFVAIHHLPLDHALFEDLREILSDILVPGGSQRLSDLVRVLKMVPGIRNLAEAISSLEGRIAYCALPAGEDESKDRCIFIALEKPFAVSATFRFVPSFAKRLMEKGNYRGAPYLHLKVPLPWSADGILTAVVGNALALTVHMPILHQVVDASRDGGTLAGAPIVNRFRPFPSQSVLVEFYSSPAIPEDRRTSEGERGRIDLLAQTLFRDRRLDGLVAGRAYSLCLRHPRGIEIITSSTTGFHWSLPTAGLAAVVARELPVGDLLAVKLKDILSTRDERKRSSLPSTEIVE